MRYIHVAALALLAATLPSVSFAAFVDNFNTGASSANYAMVSTDATSSLPTYAYNYSVMGIPAAPRTTDGSTTGLRLQANFSAPNAAEAITLFTNTTYSGDYTVTFDAWLNVNGPFPAGGTGSTHYLTAGVGGNGTTNNFVNNTGFGGWTAVNGENGNGVDYRFYKDASLQGVATAQYAAGTAATARNGLDPYYASLGNVDVSNFPVQGANNGGPAQQNGTSYAGAFGMDWHTVKLIVDADGGTGGAASMKWYVDSLLIGTLDAGANGAFTSNGKVALGYSDPTANGSDLPTHSFALIDNLEILSEPAGVAGDYNNNGTVDAADYVVWRKYFNMEHTLPNDPIGGIIKDQQFTQWRSNFGKPPGSGMSVNAIPEPTALMLLVVGTLATCLYRARQPLFAT